MNLLFDFSPVKARRLVLAFGLLFSVRGAQAVPASPDPIVAKQPDGTQIKLFIRGDEWNHWLETPTGEVVTQNPDTKAYVYAQPAAGGGVSATTSAVGKTLPPLEPFQPQTPQSAMVQHTQAAQPAIPLVGTANVFTILMTYSDTSPTVAASAFDTMLFGTQTGSMKKLYEEMSRGTFSVAAGPAGIVGWYRAPKARAYYGANYPQAAELVRDAVLLADAAGVDFAPYDQDNDGKVDVVNIVHQGPGEETSGDINDIWSHRWDLTSSGVGSVTVDGKRVNDYIMNPEMAGGAQNTIGVFAHEYGHALGLPDLYDTDNSSEGIGQWSLMASGSYNTTGGNRSGTSPAHMDAWCKMRLNWLNLVTVTSNRIGEAIPAVQNSGTVYKMRAPQFGAGEYFLVENRQKIGSDAGLPNAGLCIWHIDDSVDAGANRANTAEWYPGRTTSGHYLVALEQADGLFNLERRQNRSDAGDVWPGSAGKRAFNSGSVPDSKPYSQANTAVAVRNISASGAVMTADLIVANASLGQLVTLISPAEGATVSNTVPVRATTSNNAVFTRMDFSYRAPGVVLRRTPNLAIPDNGTVVSDTAVSTATGTIGSAKISVAITHTYIGDLLVVLVAPDGTRVPIHSRAGGSAKNIALVDFDITSALAGKSMAGNWKLELDDSFPADSGTLTSWSLNLGNTFIAIGADTNGADASGNWATSWNTAGLAAGSYEVRSLATDTDGSPELGDTNLVNLVVDPPASSGLLISEFRFHGKTGSSDEFVELYNTLTTPLNISGWSIQTNSGTLAAPVMQTSLVPANTTIPGRGHFLFTGAGYSLSGYGLSDAPISGDMADDSGVALLNAAGVAQDAVGFGSSMNVLREGAGMASAPTANSDYAFMRDYNVSLPKNTAADSTQDFVFASPLAAAMAGTGGEIVSQMGAPSPEGLKSPVYVNNQVTTLLLNPGVDQSQAPNRVRTGAVNSGTILVRRTIVNKSGRVLNRVRLSVTRITTLGSPVFAGNTAANQADVRLISSSDETVSFPDGLGGTATRQVFGTTLEADGTGQSAQPLGGGMGSSLNFITELNTPLAINETRHYSFLLQVVKSGNFNVAFNIQALSAP